MLNQIIIMGRLVKDPEKRSTQAGKTVTSFTVACERDQAAQDGKKLTDFVDCVAWDRTGEFVASYFAKGRMIAVIGRLQFRDWTDKSGQKRRNAEILVGKAEFCGDKRSEYGGNVGRQDAAHTEYAGGGQFPVIPDDWDPPF